MISFPFPKCTCLYCEKEPAHILIYYDEYVKKNYYFSTCSECREKYDDREFTEITIEEYMNNEKSTSS